VGEKRAIWQSTEIGAGEDFDSYDESSIDLDLEGELLQLILEELSPPGRPEEVKDSDEP
jgi:hypothetical protein